MSSRRRFLAIAASCAAAPGLAGPNFRAGPVPEPTVWKGLAMGALASVTLVHPDRSRARSLIARCVEEIDRLEAVFSLYRFDSTLSRLNAAGALHDPPIDLVRLLSFALDLARRSEGAFDPTVQPLFRLYADHFARPGAAASGPSGQAIARTLERIGFDAVELASDHIRLGRPGMAITLNGIAQGYVTDRIADLLRAGGMTDVLVDLGEVHAVGRRPDGAPWRAAVADPTQPDRSLFELSLGTGPGRLPALATSAGEGTRFGPDARIHHLFDPRSGRSANHHASVSVAAPDATLADGLATALSVLPPARASALLAAYPPTRAWFVDAERGVTMRGA